VIAVHVWWSSLAAADRDLLPLLDPTERARVRSLERPADQGRSLVAAALLRVAVGEALSVPPVDVVLDRTCPECTRPHGRPRVRGPGGDLPHVSVSHSGLLVVVVVSAGASVGVDVQRVADLPGPEVDVERAAVGWARREAVLKVGGGGGPVVTRPIRAPLDGYAAALATRTARAPTDDELDVRHWPAPPTPRPGARSGDRSRG
jgi:4'-phosphopantetheinyl transferase